MKGNMKDNTASLQPLLSPSNNNQIVNLKKNKIFSGDCVVNFVE